MNPLNSPNDPYPRRLGEYREPWLVLLLHVVTCSIYYWWWIYAASKEMREFDDVPDTDPGTEVLLSIITCGIYTIYWDFKTAKKIARLQSRVGLPQSDNSILYVILNLLGLGLIPSMIEQKDLNDIWHRAQQNMTNYGSYDFSGSR